MNKLVIVVVNLDPKDIAGFVSNGMMLAARALGRVSLLEPDADIAPGAMVH